MRKRYFFGVLLMAWIMVNGIRVHIQDGASVADYDGLITQATGDMINFRETWGNDEVFSIARRGTNYTLLRMNGQDSVIMGPVSRGKKQMAAFMIEDRPEPRLFPQPVLEMYKDGDLVGFAAGFNGTFGPPYNFIPVEKGLDVEVVDDDILTQNYEDDTRSKVFTLLWKTPEEHLLAEDFYDLDPCGTDYTDYDSEESSSSYWTEEGPYFHQSSTSIQWPTAYDAQIAESLTSGGSGYTLYVGPFWQDEESSAGGYKYDSASIGTCENAQEYGVLLGRAYFTNYYRNLVKAGELITYIDEEDFTYTWTAKIDGVEYDLGFTTKAGSYYAIQKIYKVHRLSDKRVFVFNFGSYLGPDSTRPIVTLAIVIPGDEKPVNIYQYEPEDSLTEPVPIEDDDWAIPPDDELLGCEAKHYNHRLFLYDALDLIGKEGAFEHNEFEVTPWQQPH